MSKDETASPHKATQLSFDGILKLLSVVGAVAAFFWGIWVWWDNNEKSANTRRIEATQPFLKAQLALYTEATQTAAKIATSKDPVEVDTATKRFWELYWGELALVENDDVEAAMVAFGRALNQPNPNQAALTSLSLDLAGAIRRSLAQSWGTDAWEKTPRKPN